MDPVQLSETLNAADKHSFMKLKRLLYVLEDEQLILKCINTVFWTSCCVF